MSDPRRLIETARPGTLTRALLEAHVVREPTEKEVGAIWGGVVSRLPGPGGSGAPSAAKLLAFGGAACVVSFVAVLVAVRSAPTSVPSTHAVDPPWVAASVEAPAPLLSPEVPVAPSSAPPAASSAAPASPVRPERPRGTNRESSLRLESELLLRARASVRSGECADALAQLDALRTRFPSSALAQEREVLSIQALSCAGRAEQASARAAVFLREHPTSPHATDVDKFVR